MLTPNLVVQFEDKKKQEKIYNNAHPKAIINIEQLFKKCESEPKSKVWDFSNLKQRQGSQKRKFNKKRSEDKSILLQTNMDNQEMEKLEPQKYSMNLQQNKQKKRIVSAQGQNYQSPYKYFQKIRRPSLPLQKCIKSRIKYKTYTTSIQNDSIQQNNSIHINNLNFCNPKVNISTISHEPALSMSVQLNQFNKNQELNKNKLNNVRSSDLDRSKIKNVNKNAVKNINKINIFGQISQPFNHNYMTVSSWNKKKQSSVIKQEYNLFQFYINQLKTRRNQRARNKKSENQKSSPITIKSIENKNLSINQQSIIRMEQLYKRWKNKQKLQISGKTIKSRKMMKKQLNQDVTQPIPPQSKLTFHRKNNKQMPKPFIKNNFFNQDNEIGAWKSQEMKDIILDEF